ncbi:MAG: hypothetical protein EXS08_01475 [Planctomycetes bacterium]|nr:hypothetical protein [Planctomycetota bacterium]
MNLDAYWQENKRFVLTVGAGGLLFLIGFAVESSLFQGQVNAATRQITYFQNELKKQPFGSEDKNATEAENTALRAAADRLAEAAAFHARPEFVPDPAKGSAANQYLRALTRVREELRQRASRARVDIDPKLGQPELSPTAEGEILRYLEALDLVESVGDLAIRARAARIDKIQVRLDPGQGTRAGVGPIERTRVQMTITGSSLSISRLLAWTQRPLPGGRVLLIDQLESSIAKGKKDEVRLDVTFVIARLRELEPAPDKG